MQNTTTSDKTRCFIQKLMGFKKPYICHKAMHSVGGGRFYFGPEEAIVQQQ
jgi:hypothetical protein